jgi:S1-C subfamily serine protease
MRREWIIALVVMGIITLALLASASVLIWRGTFQSSQSDRNLVHVYVQVPALAELGEKIHLTITVENDSEGFVPIDEIRLPSVLTDAAVIEEVFPSMNPGRQEFNGDNTSYYIGLTLEPGERREFFIQLMPWQIADVASELEVVSGKQSFSSGFRVLFNKRIVEAPTATSLPTITPTMTFTALPPTEAPTSTQIPLPYKAVVKITAKVKHSSLLRPLWGGSGTIVTPDGLILTNAHLVLPIPGARPDAFVIGITQDPSEPPIDMFYAEPVETNEDLDLAIIRIVSDLQFKPVDWQQTILPTVPLGNSDDVQLGDPLIILGYPGIGGDTITLTSGNVGGFTAQRKYGDRAYIKTSASISGGTSGGVALNSAGQMIAIPTQLGSGDEESVVDCRVITDTNGDGRVDQRDACVPVGGFINALRPINLGIALLVSARQALGLR